MTRGRMDAAARRMVGEPALLWDPALADAAAAYAAQMARSARFAHSPLVVNGSDCRSIASTSRSRRPMSKIGRGLVKVYRRPLLLSVPKIEKPATSKSCSTSTMSIRVASWSSSSRAAVVDMPLDDMMAMSNRSAIRATLSSCLKPSFSTNSIAE